MASAKGKRVSEILSKPGTALVMDPVDSSFYLIQLPYSDAIIDGETIETRLFEARQILSSIMEDNQTADTGLNTDEGKQGRNCMIRHAMNLMGATMTRLDQESLAFD